MIKYQQIIKGLNLKPPVGCFGHGSVGIIYDGKDAILFDTGSYGQRKVLAELIKDIKINKVFISHLHFDHCSNLDLIPNAEVYINKKELDFFYSKDSLSDLDIFRPLDGYLNNRKLVSFDKEQNLSQNVLIKFTYGHTAGHSSLTFREEAKNVIFAGDALKTASQYLGKSGKKENYHNLEEMLLSRNSIITEYDVIMPGHDSIIVDRKAHPVKPIITIF